MPNCTSICDLREAAAESIRDAVESGILNDRNAGALGIQQGTFRLIQAAGLITRTTTISGFAYPGETLTSTGTGQWYVDDVPIIGETDEQTYFNAQPQNDEP